MAKNPLKCPLCKVGSLNKVIDTRQHGYYIIRRRVCAFCNERVSTKEIAVLGDYVIRLKDNRMTLAQIDKRIKDLRKARKLRATNSETLPEPAKNQALKQSKAKDLIKELRKKYGRNLD